MLNGWFSNRVFVRQVVLPFYFSVFTSINHGGHCEFTVDTMFFHMNSADNSVFLCGEGFLADLLRGLTSSAEFRRGFVRRVDYFGVRYKVYGLGGDLRWVLDCINWGNGRYY